MNRDSLSLPPPLINFLLLTGTGDSDVVVMATGLSVVDVDPTVQETTLVPTTQVLSEMNIICPLTKTAEETYFISYHDTVEPL